VNAAEQTIDWGSLAADLQLVSDGGEGWEERGSNGAARVALEAIVGREALRDAVDYYITGQRGFELAPHVLWLLHPSSAIERCYEIYNEDADLDRRRSAVELLRVVADATALRWVPEFLADPDPGIQSWGFGVLEQLILSDSIEPEDGQELLAAAEQHPNTDVREHATELRDWLARNAAQGG
jgi:hypothetical protein